MQGRVEILWRQRAKKHWTLSAGENVVNPGARGKVTRCALLISTRRECQHLPTSRWKTLATSAHSYPIPLSRTKKCLKCICVCNQRSSASCSTVRIFVFSSPEGRSLLLVVNDEQIFDHDSGLSAADGCCSPYTCCIEYDVLDDRDQHIVFVGISAGILARTRGFGGARHRSNASAACALRQHFAPMLSPPHRHPTHVATGLFSKDPCTFWKEPNQHIATVSRACCQGSHRRSWGRAFTPIRHSPKVATRRRPRFVVPPHIHFRTKSRAHSITLCILYLTHACALRGLSHSLSISLSLSLLPFLSLSLSLFLSFFLSLSLSLSLFLSLAFSLSPRPSLRPSLSLFLSLSLSLSLWVCVCLSLSCFLCPPLSLTLLRAHAVFLFIACSHTHTHIQTQTHTHIHTHTHTHTHTRTHTDPQLYSTTFSLLSPPPTHASSHAVSLSLTHTRNTSIILHTCTHSYLFSLAHTRTNISSLFVGWLQLVGSIKLYVSFAKETLFCKRDL